MSSVPESTSTTTFHIDFFSTLFSGVTAKMELHIDLDEILQIKLLIHLLNKHLLKGFLVETMMDAEQ